MSNEKMTDEQAWAEHGRIGDEEPPSCILCDDTGRLMVHDDYTGGRDAVGSCACTPPTVLA